MPITVTFIRHGESLDNPKGIWAGWKDAPLSRLGQRQADALGTSLASTSISIIYASDLLRANSTGRAVHASQDPPPPFHNNAHLREQHFGIAEGHRWSLGKPKGKTLEECFQAKIFPVLEPEESFPEGESYLDLGKRAEKAIQECVLPHLTKENYEKDFHIALASHGLCISQLVPATLKLDTTASKDLNVSYAGLRNTAWTRATITLQDPSSGWPKDNLPLFYVEVTHVDSGDHLKNLPDTASTDNDTSNEPENKEAKAFFGGALKNSDAQKESL